MATRTGDELGVVFECDGGLDDFEPEPETERGLSWRRVASPTAIDRARWQPYAAPPPSRSWPILMPAVVAAAIAGAALSWAGLRFGADPEVPKALAAPVAPVPTELTRTSEAERQAAALPPAPPVATPSPAAVVPPAPANPVLDSTLAAVSRAYRDRDLAQLTAVWPGADVATLEPAFSAVKYQSLSFDRCTTRPNGTEGVVASCAVSIVAASKDGDPSLQRRRESWTLVLNRAGEGWTIAGVSAQAVP